MTTTRRFLIPNNHLDAADLAVGMRFIAPHQACERAGLPSGTTFDLVEFLDGGHVVMRRTGRAGPQLTASIGSLLADWTHKIAKIPNKTGENPS